MRCLLLKQRAPDMPPPPLLHCTLQGDYDVQVVARDLQNVELMCVVVHFEMVLPPSEAVAISRKLLKL